MRVEKIEPGNYKEGLRRIRNTRCVVLVFHPQCGHCVELRPKWEAMKHIANPNANIVEVNGSDMHSSREMSASAIGRGTEGFPSVMLMDKGKIISRYNGERSPEKLAEFVNQAVPTRSKSRARSKARRGKTKKLRRRK